MIGVCLLLIGGTVLFGTPFLSMALTSIKVDREILINEDSQAYFFPTITRPRPVSPDIDEHIYEKLQGPFQDQLLPRLVEIVD